MKAVVFTRYGSADALELREIEKPTPKDKEVLIRIHAVSLNDWTGRLSRKFQPGDQVFGDLSGTWGGFAGYVCAREAALALKSPRMTFEQAAGAGLSRCRLPGSTGWR